MRYCVQGQDSVKSGTGHDAEIVELFLSHQRQDTPPRNFLIFPTSRIPPESGLNWTLSGAVSLVLGGHQLTYPPSSKLLQ